MGCCCAACAASQEWFDCFCEMTLLHVLDAQRASKSIRAREAGKTRFNDEPEPDDRSLESNVCNRASKDS